MPGLGGLAGAVLGGLAGASLGNARGSITIDTSSAEQARMTMRRVGQDMERSLHLAAGRVREFGLGLKGLRGELLAVGMAGGLLTRLGLGAALSMKQYRVAFRELLGDEKQAVQLMEQLTQAANEFGIEVTEVWQLGRSLLPVLKGNTKELDTWVKRAALLASTNPFKGTAEAARALQEYLADQPVSLRRIFNIPASLIAEAKAQFEDMGDQIDFILARMGATEAGARDMANAWISLRNEMQLLLAVGFTPLLEILQPVMSGFRQWLGVLRETHPELAILGSGIAAIAVIGAPTLLFLTQMIVLLEKLQKMQGLGALAGLGKFGLLGLAGLGGAVVGVEIGRAVGRHTGDERMAEMTLGTVFETIRHIWFAEAYVLARVFSVLGAAVASEGQKFVEALAFLAEGIAGFLQRLGSILPDWAGGDALTQAAEQLLKAAEEQQRQAAERLERAQPIPGAGGLNKASADALLKIGQLLGFGALLPGGAGAGAAAAGAGGPAYTEEQLAVITQWAEDIRRIEEDAAQARVDVTNQYEQQRTEIIAQYELTILRDAEDYARQRARQEADLQRSIMDIRESTAQREAEWWQDLQDNIAEMREDGAERLEQIQKDHQERLERLQRDHRDRLLEAAARLDARAVAEEQRRYRNQTTDMQKDLEQRIRQEHENLEERIAQAQEAHARRVKDARAADEQRIRDMQETLARQQAQEDEDRALRLQRMAEDHQRQLEQMDVAHWDRLQQIDRQAAQERRLLDWAFVQQMAQEGKHTQLYLELQGQRQRHSLKLFDEFWNGVDALIRSHMPSPPPYAGDYVDPGTGSRYQFGGPVEGTGLAMLHGTRMRPEYVLSADTTDVLRRMLGGGFTQPQLVGAVAGGAGPSRSLSIGAIEVYEARNAGDTARAVRAEIVALFRDLADERSS